MPRYDNAHYYAIHITASQRVVIANLQLYHATSQKRYKLAPTLLQNVNMKSHVDWTEQVFTSSPTQYRLYGRRFLQVKRPNQQYQSTEGTSTKEKENN